MNMNMNKSEEDAAMQNNSGNEKLAILQGIERAVVMAHVNSLVCGWYNDPVTGQPFERNFGEMIALIHSELSEALEAHRKDTTSPKIAGYSGVEEELADAVLRICDLAGHLDLELAGAVLAKNEFNRTRAALADMETPDE
jgi:NTP pyrophosphatase (non-canonical NTP hydrolase)